MARVDDKVDWQPFACDHRVSGPRVWCTQNAATVQTVILSVSPDTVKAARERTAGAQVAAVSEARNHGPRPGVRAVTQRVHMAGARPRRRRKGER